jgi:hypothetical protein
MVRVDPPTNIVEIYLCSYIKKINRETEAGSKKQNSVSKLSKMGRLAPVHFYTLRKRASLGRTCPRFYPTSYVFYQSCFKLKPRFTCFLFFIHN